MSRHKSRRKDLHRIWTERKLLKRRESLKSANRQKRKYREYSDRTSSPEETRSNGKGMENTEENGIGVRGRRVRSE